VHNYSNIAAIITDINVSHELKNYFSEAATTEKSWKRYVCSLHEGGNTHYIIDVGTAS
jgi:hypothetical protein